jgi:hypothetical protein
VERTILLTHSSEANVTFATTTITTNIAATAAGGHTKLLNLHKTVDRFMIMCLNYGD